MPDRLRPNVGNAEEQRPKSAGLLSRIGTGVDRWLRDLSGRAVNSLVWRVFVVAFTVLLLFGSPIQFWLVPASGDYTFDALYLLGFAFFWVDIVFNSYADPEYFHCGPSRSYQQGTNPNFLNQTRICSFRLGSYNFWCDFISSGGFLWDVSFINQWEFAMKVMSIALDSMGVPTNFDSVVYGARAGAGPLDNNFNFIFIVIKAARVARLVPSTRVVAISTRINLYWYIERLLPTFYWRGWKKNREQARRMKDDTEAKRSPSNRVRRASWGGLDIVAISSVKRLAGEKRKEKERQNPVYRAWEGGKGLLRLIGVLPNSNVELNRHIAATKIQRAWRSRLAKPTEARSDDGIQVGSLDDTFAWTSRDGASLASTQKKRPMLSRNANGTKSAGQSSNEHIRESEAAPEFQQLSSNGRPRHQFHRGSSRAHHSQVGAAMAENTGERVGIFILLSLLFVLLFTYHEPDSTRPSTMVVLYGQTIRSQAPDSARKAVDTARLNAIPSIYYYASNSSYYETEISVEYNIADYDASTLRERDRLRIVVNHTLGFSEGYFVIRQQQVEAAQIEIVATIFVLLIWFFGVAAFAGPIMTFVIIPIERMVRLLGMLMMDPLGYQSNFKFKKFLAEEDQIVKKSQWTREVLKGMETSFLMSTILRIGSLMKVGFGSAGVEIIRNNLQKGQSKNMLILNSRGSTVSCIFLFCDIRQFTDATECLQEEVFVFTNRIAAVVHSICHSYGGSANKNVGDAFLVSWLLEDESTGTASRFSSRNTPTYVAKHNEADKALLSVVKICMALHHDEYYVEPMSNLARTALLNKLKNRPGPIVQMGFGLHAGKAVQGAIGSQKKIDATYVSEAVERAEYLESSTKKYKVQMLMSDNFHWLLHPSNRRRCRKIDQIMFQNEDDDDYEEEAYGQGDVMELFTYDLDVDALWEDTKKGGDGENSEIENEEASISSLRRIPGSSSISRAASANTLLKNARRLSKRDGKGPASSDDSRSASIGSQGEGQIDSGAAADAKAAVEAISLSFRQEAESKDHKTSTRPELVLPTGPALYSSNVWLQADMRRIRRRYTPAVFSTFSSGLQKYYDKDWAGAKLCFEAIVDHFDDGPSRYFLDEMEKNNFTPPPHFQSYGKA